jgi:hypothetical protein
VFVWPTAKPALLAAITVLTEAFGEYAFVSAKLPAHTRPDRFVKVSRVGGTRDNIATDAARILVECYAKDVGQVEAMCNTANAALYNAGGTSITADTQTMFIRAWNETSGATDYPNPDVLDYERWQITGELLVKAN